MEVDFGQPMRVLAGEGTLRALRAVRRPIASCNRSDCAMRQKTMPSMGVL